MYTHDLQGTKCCSPCYAPRNVFLAQSLQVVACKTIMSEPAQLGETIQTPSVQFVQICVPSITGLETVIGQTNINLNHLIIYIMSTNYR